MAVISGGTVSAQGVQSTGNRPPIYYTNGVPTDGTISTAFTPSNGALAVNVANGQLYERQAGAWVRVDTI
jgi:hypothetical protein